MVSARALFGGPLGLRNYLNTTVLSLAKFAVSSITKSLLNLTKSLEIGRATQTLVYSTERHFDVLKMGNMMSLFTDSSFFNRS